VRLLHGAKAPGVGMTFFLSTTVLPLLMILAGAGDVLTMRIPNWLTLAVAASFFPLAFMTGLPLSGLALHVAVGIAMFAAGFLLFSVGLFGGGDAKLLAAAALWFGWPGLVPFLVFTVFAGGVLALTIGLWSLLNVSSEVKGGLIFRRLGGLKPNVPYGFALAAGALLAFPETWWVTFASQS